MLLKELDGVAEGGESLDGLVLDLGHVSEVSHDLGQKLVVGLLAQILGQNLDSILDLFYEVLNVLDLLGGVVVEEASELLDPAVDDGLQFLDEGLRVDSEPADVGRWLHALDARFVLVQASDLGVEHFERGLLSHNIFEDFVGHSIEVLNFNFDLLILEVFTGVKLLKEGFLHGGTLIEEGLEGRLEVLLP